MDNSTCFYVKEVKLPTHDIPFLSMLIRPKLEYCFGIFECQVYHISFRIQFCLPYTLFVLLTIHLFLKSLFSISEE